MAPRPPRATRLALLGCGLAAALALSLCACGGGGSATAESAPARQAPPPPRSASDHLCPAPVSAFADSLERLRRALAVGLSYEQYAARIGRLRRAYGEIPFARLEIGCLLATGTPAERAFDGYLDAANAWGECLADAACTTASIEPVLQRKWRRASGLLPEAE